MKKVISIFSMLLCASFSAMENSNSGFSYLQMLEVHAARAKKILCQSQINLADYPHIISLGSIGFALSAAEQSPTSQVMSFCSKNTPIPLDQLPKPNNLAFWYIPDHLGYLKRVNLVLAMGLLNTSMNKESFINELMKAVKPGGTIITSGNPADKEEIEKILSEKNLKVTKTTLCKEPLIYPNKEAIKTYFYELMLDWKNETFNHLTLNDERLKNEYLEWLIEKNLAYSPQPDGTITVSTPEQVYITLAPPEQKQEDK